MNTNIDLNVSVPFLNLRSTAHIKIIVKQKLACRDVLVQKFGEDGYNTIVASSEPLIMFKLMMEEVLVFVIV